MIWTAWFGLQTVRCAHVECRPSNSTIWIADRQIQRFGVQTFKFNDMEGRPSNVQIDNTIRLELEHLFATMLIDGVQKLRPSEFRI